MREHLKTIKSTQIKYLLGKILIVRQSAGNQTLFNNNEVGSSETKREMLKLKNVYLLNFYNNLNYWFTFLKIKKHISYLKWVICKRTFKI